MGALDSNDSFDNTKPNVARMYDYYLGGKTNFEADRVAAEEVMRLSPVAAKAAQDNRRFLSRAIWYLAHEGIRQFIDIGVGLPTMDNTHQIALRADSLSRVVYVDKDPVAVNHGKVLLKEESHSIVLEGDLREPQEIMRNAELLGFLDMSQPVAVILAAILHFIEDSQAYTIVDYLKNTVPLGSALVISHATADEATGPEINTVQSVYRQASSPIFLRTQAEVTRFFDGLRLADPGVVDINAWRPIVTPEESQAIGYGGVGIKLANQPECCLLNSSYR